MKEVLTGELPTGQAHCWRCQTEIDVVFLKKYQVFSCPVCRPRCWSCQTTKAIFWNRMYQRFFCETCFEACEGIA